MSFPRQGAAESARHGLIKAAARGIPDSESEPDPRSEESSGIWRSRYSECDPPLPLASLWVCRRPLGVLSIEFHKPVSFFICGEMLHVSRETSPYAMRQPVP